MAFSSYSPEGPAQHSCVHKPAVYRNDAACAQSYRIPGPDSIFPIDGSYLDGYHTTPSSIGGQDNTDGPSQIYSPSVSSPSSSYPIYGECEEPDIFGADTMHVDDFYLVSQNHPRPRSPDWQQWETMDPYYLASMPVAAARPSVEYAPQRPNDRDRDLLWRRCHVRQYLHTHDPPQPFFDFSLQPLYPPQPDTLSSSLSTSHPYPPVLVSPLTSTSDVPPPSPSSARSPIILHQPRPSRRIPIVSLSELAMACDDFSMTSSKLSHNLLSPLPLHLSIQPTPARVLDPPSLPDDPTNDDRAPRQAMFRDKPALSSWSEGAVLCSCGCMGSYIVAQK